VVVISSLSVVAAAAADFSGGGGECFHQTGEQAITLVGLGWNICGDLPF
jgi:hypothetical protein